MIFSKRISILLSGLFYLFCVLLLSTVSAIFLKVESLPVIGVFIFVVFYFITKSFYSYLRNDEKYKNNNQVSSDMPGENYITKGEHDSKKLFVVVWLLIMLILTSLSLWLYSFNQGIV